MLWTVLRHAAAAGVAATLVGTTGCTPYRVRTDYDPEVSFAAIKTYAWIDSNRVVRDSTTSPFLARRVRRAVDWVLEQRGLTQVEGDEADVLVTAFVIEAPPGRRTPHRAWAWAPCGPVVSLRIAVAYPFGLSIRRPRLRTWTPYFRSPWGYACAYRIGIGYVWMPVYDDPGDRFGGTLVIDVLDRRTREPIWRGTAQGALLESEGQARSQEEIDDLVLRLLAGFPPAA